MSSSDEDNEKLAHPEFWDARYTTGDGEQPTHEWFRTFEDLKPFLERRLFAVKAPETNPQILHLGSGDSTIPRDLAVHGYRKQLCVDFSEVVVKMMGERHADIEGIEWKLMDVMKMDSVSSNSIDVAFDKGTLDAMIFGSIWTPPDEVKERTGAYLREVFRVLKDDGIFLYVTFRPTHYISRILDCEGVDWDSEIETLGGEASLPYHAYILKKKAPTA